MDPSQISHMHKQVTVSIWQSLFSSLLTWLLILLVVLLVVALIQSSQRKRVISPLES